MDNFTEELMAQLTNAARIEQEYQDAQQQRRDNTKARKDEAKALLARIESEDESLNASLKSQRADDYAEIGFDGTRVSEIINTLSHNSTALEALLASPHSLVILDALKNNYKGSGSSYDQIKTRNQLAAILYLSNTPLSQMGDGFNRFPGIAGRALDDLPKPLQTKALTKLEADVDTTSAKPTVTETDLHELRSLIWCQSIPTRLRAKSIELALHPKDPSERPNLGTSLGSAILRIHEDADLADENRNGIYRHLARIFKELQSDIDKIERISIFGSEREEIRICDAKFLLEELASPIQEREKLSDQQLLEHAVVPAALLRAQILKKGRVAKQEEGNRLLKRTVRKHWGAVRKAHARGIIPDDVFDSTIQSARHFGILHLIRGIFVDHAAANRKATIAQDQTDTPTQA